MLFNKYRKLIQLLRPEFCDSLIKEIEQVKGYLINYQSILIYLMSLDLPKNAEAVEVGVWHGRTTVVLKSANIDYKLHCVDTFLGSEEHQEELKGYKFRKDFENNLVKYGVYKNLYIHEGMSVDVAKEFKDNSLDLVWIDAGHSYGDLCSDIKAWTPKLKSGGIILGHDMPNRNDPNGGFEELVKAVTEKVINRIDVYRDYDELCNIWGAIKI